MHADRLFDRVAHLVCQGVALEKIVAACEGVDRRSVEDLYDSLTDRSRALPPESEHDTLALIGDFPHDPSYIRPALETALGSVGMRVRFLYEPRLLDAEALAGPRLLVVLRDGMLWPEPGGEPVFWLTEEQEQAIAGFVSRGGGFLALHNATALKCLDQRPTLYREVLGSSYTGHGPGDERFSVRVVDHDHPVTSGVADYPAIDERHWPAIHAPDARILLEAVSGNERSVNGYVRSYGDGRVCYLASGHTSQMLSCDSMQRLISNAARWCAGQVIAVRAEGTGAPLPNKSG